MTDRIYLDNAATSWPKPDSVAAAMMRQLSEGAAAGRGDYLAGTKASQIVESCRCRIASLLHAASPREIAFTCNGSHALNIPLQGLLRQGDHVVTTQIEHNSVLRPLEHLRQIGKIEIDVAACDVFGFVSIDAIRDSITPNTRLIVVSHASNVTGAIQDLEAIGRLAKEHGIFLMVDAAQTAGHIDIDVQTLGIDILASSGHKGCLGPLGTGFLYCNERTASQVEPLVYGGTGSASDHLEMPASGPEKYEAGNLNVPAIAGLAAALSWLDEQTNDPVCEGMVRGFVQRIAALPSLQVFRQQEQPFTNVVSLVFDHALPAEVAAILDAEFGIEVRAGLHCSPLIHQALGTEDGGTIRFSFGRFTTQEHVEKAASALAEIATVEMF